MKERALKFIWMVAVVVAVGVSMTLLNIRLQQKIIEATEAADQAAAGGGNGGPEDRDAGEAEEELANVAGVPAAQAAEGREPEAGGPVRADTDSDMPVGQAQPAAAGPAEEKDGAGGRRSGGEAEETVEKRAQTEAEPEKAGGFEEVLEKSEEKASETAAVIITDESETRIYVSQDDSLQVEFELLVTDGSGGMAASAEDYYRRLSEMDSRLTAREEEAAKKTAADRKAAADEALKFWDDELNMVYQAIRAGMTDEEFDVLRTEEKAWLRSRDAAASEAAGSGSQSNSASSLAYTVSLVQWTKERVYELAEMYYGE